MPVETSEKPGDPAHVEETATEARQGAVRHNVRYVLTVSLGATLAVLALVWLLFFWD
jgi:hypothetical protein